MRLLPWLLVLAGPALSVPAPARADDPDDLSGFVPVDEFNPDVKPKDGSHSQPVRGGVLRIRSPGDPKSLNPLCDNEAMTRQVHEYIRTDLADRDRETFEWLPMLARRWETRDTVALTDGSKLEGRIVAETPEEVSFAPGAARHTLAQHELLELRLADGTALPLEGEAASRAFGQTGRLIPRPGTGLPELSGTLRRPPGGRYTVWLDETPREVRVIPRAEVLVTLEGAEGAKEAVPSLRRDASFVFHLRPGLQWHDGQPVSAEDVIFSIDTMRNPAVEAQEVRALFTDLESWEQLDPLTVRFVYGAQYFKAFSVIAEMYVYPRHRFQPDKFQGDPDGFGKHFNAHPDHQGPIGCGPYRFVRWEHGKFVELARNEGWWASGPPGPDGRLATVVPWIDPQQPYLDRIRWVTINEKTAALKALEAGDVDADFDVEQTTWEDRATNSPEFVRRNVRARFLDPSYTYIGWNMRRKDVGPERQFFADRRVRTAMTLLIPRERILREIHRGMGEIATGPFFSHGPFADRAIKPHPSSLERAQMLLDEAGWIDHDGDGVRDRDGVAFEFEYVIHNMRDYHQKVADIIKESVERAGVRVLIRKLDWAVFLDTIRDQRFDAVRLAWGDPSCIDADPFETWHSSQSEGGGSNYVSYADDEVDRLIIQGRREVDLVKRQALYRKLHRILHREQPYTFLNHMFTLAFYGRKYRNVRFTIIGETPYDFRDWYIPRELQGSAATPGRD